MNRSVARLIFAAIALATAAGPTAMSAAAPHTNADVDVLVGGSAQAQHAHQGRRYIEALKGREYAIRLRNPYGVRVAVALSVDGLNTIDGRHSTAADARKWVIDPHGSVTISGWQTSRSVARRFEFTTEERSYAQALGSASNLGVISAVYFRERRPAIARDESRSRADRAGSPRAPSAAPASEAAAAAGSNADAVEEYAATGMGRRTDHSVTQVWLDLEDTPAQRVDIRYEFRPQLVRLGVLPGPESDSLRRRERASGFEPGFSPEPPSVR
jgi:hypothetical protein